MPTKQTDKTSRPRDDRGRFPKSARPSFDELLESFGPSWSKWRTLAQAIETRESTRVDDSRASSLDSRASKGGMTAGGNEGGNIKHGTLSTFSEFFDFEFYKQCTGREPYLKKIKEIWAQVGRGGGKTRAASAALVSIAVREYPTLAPGERGKAFLLAQNRSTARQAFGYVRGILKGDKLLNRMLESETKNTISLTNGIDIEIVSANFKHVRGFSVVAAVLDEVAFYWLNSDAANSDVEILNSIRPGLSRVPGSVLLVISSPHVARGALYEANKRYFGNEHENILFWKATTSEMNPTFDITEISIEPLQRIALIPLGR